MVWFAEMITPPCEKADVSGRSYVRSWPGRVERNWTRGASPKLEPRTTTVSPPAVRSRVVEMELTIGASNANVGQEPDYAGTHDA